jgi:hypothetical protein
MNYDILVLMNPTYPFTPYEIENIKNFYNKGGNILITAGMHTMAAIDSINTLLNELDSGISFSNTMSIAKPVDYFSEMHYAFMIEDVEKDHPIFNGVSTFITGPGALLEVEYANQTLANASEYCIAAYKDRTEEGKGKIVAFNDQIFLSNSFRSYTDDEIYLNDRLTENVFKYLAPNNTIGINIIESRLNHTTTQGNFTISVLNRTSNTGMTGLGSNQLNATLFNNGNEIDTLTIIEKGGGNYFIESIPITENMSSPYPYVMTINFTLGVENRIKNYSFFYYNSSNLFSFVNGTVTNGPIIRNQTSAAYIQFNSTLPSVSDANLTVYGNYMASSMFSRKSSVSFSEVASKNISDNYYHIKPQPLNTTPSGFLYFYGVMEKDDYILLTPDRWMARIPNEIPLFYNNSKFSGFGVTQLLQAGIATLSISSSTTEFFVDLYDLEDGVENLPGMRVTISFIPIGIIDGYYYPVFAAEEIYYELPYNFEKEGFYEEITIPRNITITEFGIERNISMYNNPKLFYLVSVSVRDLDGGSNGFLYVILFGDMYDSIGDYGPLVFSSIAIIGIVIVCIILEKNRKKRELGFGYNTYPNSEIRSF